MAEHHKATLGPDERDYDVGYGKPPKDSQFKTGRSGNPSGRPKKPPSLRDSLSKALCKEITVQTADGPETMAMMDVVITAMVNAAAKGKVGSSKLVTSLVERLEIGEEDQTTELTEADKTQFGELMRILSGRNQ